MLDEKYLVFKKSEFDSWYVGISDLQLMPQSLDDAVVIRTQDAFATGGLWAYCHNIRTYMELGGNLIKPPFNRRELNQCEITAQYFANRAMEAQAILEAGKAKVPD